MDTRLRGWAQEFKAAFPENAGNANLWQDRITDFTPLTSLEHAQTRDLNTFLTRLRTTKDYINRSTRANTVLRVERMIQLACRDTEFKNLMLGLLTEGLISCGDRLTLFFNELEIQLQPNNQRLSDEEFKQLCIGISRYRLLTKYAQNVCTRRGLGDAIETILFYHIRLRDALQLPITTQGMLYPAMAAVTDVMLFDAEKSIREPSDTQLLEQSEHWQQRMSLQNKEGAQAVNEKFVALLAAAQDYYDLAENERAKWIETCNNPELKKIVSDPNIKNFVDASKAIMQAQERALAHLGGSDGKDPS